MGEDLSLPERESVRTAMQWSADEPNAGFSTAPAGRLGRTVISGGELGYEQVNVAAQQRDPESLLHWMERLVRVRKQCREIGWGNWEILETGDPAVFALRSTWQEGSVVTVHNLADRQAAVRLPLDGGQPLYELLGDRPYEVIDSSQEIALEPYGYRWFRLGGSRSYMF